MRAVAALLALAAGCVYIDAPDVGDLAPGLTTCDDSDPAIAVSFSAQIRPLTTRSPGGCSCHRTSTTSGLNLASYEGLRRGGLNSGTDIIIPGQPCDSLLVQKLSPAPPFGARMPYNGPPYFTPEELQLVGDWIAEGALNN